MSETGAEPQFMRDSLQAAAEAHLASTGGGFVQSMVFAIEAIDPSGEPIMFIGGPESQTTVRSLGLTKYLTEWYDAKARLRIEAAQCDDECCAGEDD